MPCAGATRELHAAIASLDADAVDAALSAGAAPEVPVDARSGRLGTSSSTRALGALLDAVNSLGARRAAWARRQTAPNEGARAVAAAAAAAGWVDVWSWLPLILPLSPGPTWWWAWATAAPTPPAAALRAREEMLAADEAAEAETGEDATAAAAAEAENAALVAGAQSSDPDAQILLAGASTADGAPARILRALLAASRAEGGAAALLAANMRPNSSSTLLSAIAARALMPGAQQLEQLRDIYCAALAALDERSFVLGRAGQTVNTVPLVRTLDLVAWALQDAPDAVDAALRHLRLAGAAAGDSDGGVGRVHAAVNAAIVAPGGTFLPLTAAVFRRSATVTALLLAAGADPNLQPTAAVTRRPGAAPPPPADPALLVAVQARDTAVLELLLRAGADTRMPRLGAQRLTPLLAAASAPVHDADSLAVLHSLLKAGADVHAADAHGTTPLHAAAQGGDPRAIARLLSFGANPLAADNGGRSPAHWLEHGDEPPTSAMLDRAQLHGGGGDINKAAAVMLRRSCGLQADSEETLDDLLSMLLSDT